SILQCLGLTALIFLCSACHGPKTYLSVKEGPVLSYSRSMCFGPCPAFTLTVDADGQAQYNGKANVQNMGSHKAQWPESHLEGLAQTAAAMRLDQKAGVYDNPLVTDLPTTRLTFGKHHVMDRINGPDLEPLYTALDSLIKATAWTPDSNPKQ
ncbi:MAG: DUF6438 domain-containing protein, partial [Flavobacteriales bacterium]|nr:DUF6438 domain-containing protein [Flavobacteriales bacterium]